MTPRHRTGIGTRFGAATLAALIIFQPVPGRALGTSPKAKARRCGALERKLETQAARGVRACGKAVATAAVLRCAHQRRAQAAGSLFIRGCSAPWWSETVHTASAGKDTVALTWRSRTNWARLLDRATDPIGSTVLRPDGSFENLVLVRSSESLDDIVSYIEDVDVRTAPEGASGPSLAPGGRGGARGNFPISTGGDQSIQHAIDVMNNVITSCSDTGGTSMIEADGDVNRTLNAIKDDANNAHDFSGGADNGNRGLAFAGLVADIVQRIYNAATDDDDAPPPSDDDQCVVNDDGSCTTGSEDGDTETSSDGDDDPEGSDGAATPAAAPAPAPAAAPSAGMPGIDDGDRPRCGDARATAEQITSDCNEVKWQTSLCQAFARAANGCLDSRLIDPGPEGDVPCSGAGMSEDEYLQKRCEERNRIAQPGLDGDLRCVKPDLAGKALPDSRNDLCSDPRAQVTDCGTSDGGDITGPEDSRIPRPDPHVGPSGVPPTPGH
jgi:hypothetical protein